MYAPTTAELQAHLDGSPFIRFLGLTVESVNSTDHVIAMKMLMRPELERIPGTAQFHGGPIASLIDIAGDFAVALSVNGPVPTINFRVDYLRPSVGTHLRGVARARRVGRTIAVVDVDVLDDQGRLCAIGRGCYGAKPG